MDITTIFQQITAYIDTAVGGNEFASGIILGGVMGSLTYLARYIPSRSLEIFQKHVTTRIHFNSTQLSFHLILEYFAKEGLSDSSRSIKVGNGMWGEDRKQTKEIGYGTHWFWFGGIPIKIDLTQEDGSSASSTRIKEFMTITKFGRSHKLFNDLLEETREKRDLTKTAYKQGGDYEEHICSQPVRPFASVILDKTVRDRLKTTIDSFVGREAWSKKHGIPYQLGILLYGPPGTGKTSLIKAIADYMNKDIVIVSTVEELEQSSKITKDIIVAEEIDTFGLTKRKDKDEELVGTEKTAKDDQTVSKKSDFSEDDNNSFQSMAAAYGAHVLGKVLKSLDGIISNHGRIIIITSNKVEQLDAALLRPGRIDLQLEIGYFTLEMLEDFLNKFYDNVSLQGRRINKDVMGAKVQNDVILKVPLDEIINRYTTQK
ncbi:AAA family ATPase [bacterium]|nr:AAA family ATPase [bacterium]